MYSLLQKKPKVITDPNPHIIIEDALPWDLYEELEKTFPEEQVLNTIPFESLKMQCPLLAHSVAHKKYRPALYLGFFHL